jgi:hypothetical protein
MLHLHDLPLEQTQSQIIQTQHQSRWDFNQTKEKQGKQATPSPVLTAMQ